MTIATKRLYKEAKNNQEFMNALKDQGEKKHSPSMFWCDITKTIFATCYMGWKVARGEWDESIYDF